MDFSFHEWVRDGELEDASSAARRRRRFRCTSRAAGWRGSWSASSRARRASRSPSGTRTSICSARGGWRRIPTARARAARAEAEPDGDATTVTVTFAGLTPRSEGNESRRSSIRVVTPRPPRDFRARNRSRACARTRGPRNRGGRSRAGSREARSSGESSRAAHPVVTNTHNTTAFLTSRVSLLPTSASSSRRRSSSARTRSRHVITSGLIFPASPPAGPTTPSRPKCCADGQAAELQ